MLEYIKEVASSALTSIFKIPVFFFIVTEAAIGSLIDRVFGVSMIHNFASNEYPNLDSDDEGGSSEEDSDSNVKKVDLDFLDLGDDEEVDVDDSCLRSNATSNVTTAKIISPTPQYPAKKQEDLVEELVEQEGSAGAGFNFDISSWVEVNDPCVDTPNSKIIGAGAGVIDDEGCNSDVETLD